ncbi:MAG: pyridoxal phosphate-dependent aminotransferase [Pseudobdellovibrionaceae bacterium]
MQYLAERAKLFKGSPTLALVALAKDLKSQGHDVISLTVGEPDWPTFSQVSEAGIEAIKTNYTKYTAAQGSVELRQKIAQWTELDFKIKPTSAQIVVGPGAKFVLYSSFIAILNPGDEVVLAAPYWVSYPSMIELAGGKPKIVMTTEKTHFKLLAVDLEKAITPKTKAFLFCSPSNPTGMMYTEKEIKDIAEVLRKYPNVMILADDIYNHLVFESQQVAPHLLHVAPELASRLVSFNGGSKSFSMTGWRIGWAVGPAEIIKAMADFQSQALGAPSSIAQYALEKTILNCDNDIKNVSHLLRQRLRSAMDAFDKIPEFIVHEPQGAFYLWVDISKVLGKKINGEIVADSKKFCEVLLNRFFVATVPGIECGVEGFMRLSFATSEENMSRAVDRMRDFIDQLK